MAAAQESRVDAVLSELDASIESLKLVKEI